MMRKAFQMFDTSKTGFIETIKISTILNTMGQLFDDNELQALIDENDPERKYIHIANCNLYERPVARNVTLNQL